MSGKEYLTPTHSGLVILLH